MTQSVQAPAVTPALPPSVLAGSREGLAEVSATLGAAIASARAARRPRGPLPPGTPAKVLADAARALGPAVLPEDGIGAELAVSRLAAMLVEHGVDLSHPMAAAHLQPPPLAVAVAADALASASNASLDTYDSGPSAIAVERWLIKGLAGLASLGERADGVLTPGGSMSNLLALLLARDAAAHRRGVDARRSGVAALPGPVVFCSELAHFSVHRACAALGLGEDTVRPLPVDSDRRLRPDALSAALRDLGPGDTPIAVIATAGTTDFGTVDPLPSLAELCSEWGTWLHVDAAYGFGALFSERLGPALAGIELADSITVDLHKVGWQPAAASALLVSDAGAFAVLDRTVAYLNPVDDADAGYDGLLGRSLQTTRRPDAVKVAASLLAHGRRGIGQMVDICHDLAVHAEHRIAAEPRLELVSAAELTTVVFRYLVDGVDAATLDRINGALRRRLLESGTALIGRTAARILGSGGGEAVCLKFTLLNPTAMPADIDDLVDAVLHAGEVSARAEEAAG